MRAVLQRVTSASVTIDGNIVSSLNGNKSGLLVLLGVAEGDTETESQYLAKKTAELRIFEDEQGKMNRSVTEVGGSILVVSQFTLLADWRSGRRPGFSGAAKPEEGRRLYEHYVETLKGFSLPVSTGEFGADMKVALVNDGPVTLILDTKEK